MKEKNFYILFGIIIAVVIVFMIWYLPFKFNDCLKVGHSKLYCILDLWK